MSLETDRLIDRRRLKRHLTFWRLLAVVAVVVAGLVALDGTGEIDKRRAHVARLDVEGIIVDDPWRSRALRKLIEEDDAKALVVRINSPGGTVAGGEALYLDLRAVAARKPVVAVMGEVAASGGYMTAIAADRLFARQSTITGSIGVLLQTTDVTTLLDKLGVRPEAIKSRPLKAQPNPLEPLTPEAREASRALVLDMFDMFVDMVAERREMPREEVARLADGRVYTGRQAVANRLADAIGGETEARAWLAEARDVAEDLPAVDVEIDYPREPWEKLVEGLAGRFGVKLPGLPLDGLLSLWHPGL